MNTYDLIVIGAGSGGLSAAYTAVGFGKRVLLIDKELPGGECTWSGCMPSKAFIHEASQFYSAKKLAPGILCDTTRVMNNVRSAIARIYEGESPKKLSRDGIVFKTGHASLLDSHTVSLDKERFHGAKIIIATGSSPRKLTIEGMDQIKCHDNTTLFKLKKLPQSMVVVGGGPIGIEMAQALNRLGVQVDLVVKHDRILQKEDEAHALTLQQVLQAEGLVIHLNALPDKVRPSGDEMVMTIRQDGKLKELKVAAVFTAIGRVPNSRGMGLEKLGILDKSGRVSVNDFMETPIKGIYAVGDVAGPYLFSHMANAQAIQAVQNAFLPIRRKVDYRHVVWTTFTDPEISQAGYLERDVKADYGKDIGVFKCDYSELDRAVAQGNDTGSVKIVTDRKGRILGASVLGDRSGEIISEIQVLKTLGIPLYKISRVVHPYPTYSEVLIKLGKRAAVERLKSNPLVKLLRK